MPVHICVLQSAIAELFAQVSNSRSITLADRYGLMAALLDDSLSEEETKAIDRMLYAVRKNRLQIVNEISAIL